MEVTGSSLSEARSKEESIEMPVEKNKLEPRSNQAEETTEADPSDSHQETEGSNELEVREGDQEEDKVMRHKWMKTLKS